MKVHLLRFTADPELLCGAAASTTIKAGTPSNILKTIDMETSKRKIQQVTAYGHGSIIEHAYFTFSIEETSRAMTHQLVRHRIASYTQQSQRYVTYDTLEKYVTPPSIEENRQAQEMYDDTLTKISETYEQLIKMGIPKEDARFILPNAAKTNIIVTMNARELRHFFNLRCCKRAQWELREAAIEMLKKARKAAPALFEGAGPTCVELGYCIEGKMKPAECNIAEIRNRFQKL